MVPPQPLPLDERHEPERARALRLPCPADVVGELGPCAGYRSVLSGLYHVKL